MRRIEFCRSHGLGLSTLTRYLKRQKDREGGAASKGVGQSRLVAVELSGSLSPASVECSGVLTVLLSNRRRVEVGRGFDAATLTQLVTVLEGL
jgi:hypothetical protein